MTVKRTNQAPYYDDFDRAKNFHRILFRPGYAVQARELTQLQTMLQQQIGQFAEHLFTEGSQVIPGGLYIDHMMNFVKVEDEYDGTETKSFIADLQGLTITGQTTGVKAQVIDTTESAAVSSNLFPALFVRYIETGDDNITDRFEIGEDLVATVADNPSLSADIAVTVRVLGDNGEAPTEYTANATTDVVGNCILASIDEGIYFIGSTFIRNETQRHYVAQFTDEGSYRVGFRVDYDVVTYREDDTLLDPSRGSYNYSAPGANRQKITLTLTSLPIASIDEDEFEFIELARINEGVIQERIEKPELNEIERKIARHSDEANGSYEVDKLTFLLREHSDIYPEAPMTPVEGKTYADPDKFVVSVDSGRAYVDGYPIDYDETRFVSVDKARNVASTIGGTYVEPEDVDQFLDPNCPCACDDAEAVEIDHTEALDGELITAEIGNYILVDTVAGAPNIGEYEEVNLVSDYSFDGTYPTGTVVGTANISYIRLNDDAYGANPEFRVGLFNIEMQPGFTFVDDVRSIRRADGTFGANISSRVFRTGYGRKVGSTVTGINARFEDDYEVGDIVFIDNILVGIVATIVSQDELTLTNNPGGVILGPMQVLQPTVFEGQKKSLLFKTGYEFTSTVRGVDGLGNANLQNTIATVFRQFDAQAAVSSELTISLSDPNEIFVDDSEIKNWVLINETSGEVVDIDAGDIAFNDPQDRTSVTISGLVTGDDYVLYAGVIQSGAAGAERSKTLQTNASVDFVNAAAQVDVFALTDYDIFRLVDVRTTPGDYTAYDPNRSISILNRYRLDNGQRPTHYDTGSVILKNGFPQPEGAVRVIYDYFSHSGSGNYFSVDSYAGLDYDDIPYFGDVRLSDVYDYRPFLGQPPINDLPIPGSSIESSLIHYMPRIDKIVMSNRGEIYAIKGVPSNRPQAPEDPRLGLVLADIFIPAYTQSIEDVEVRRRDNRRYEVPDIGKLERRIGNVERYISLNDLEDQAEDKTIIDPTSGLDRFKTGFIVDKFNGHDMGAVDDPEYNIAVNTVLRDLRPTHFTDSVRFVEDIESADDRVGYAINNNVITLPFYEQPFIKNDFASTTMNISAIDSRYVGTLNLNPVADVWKSQRTPAQQIVSPEYAATEWESYWGEWETNWVGGDTSSNLPGTINGRKNGNRVIDQTLIAYLRPHPVVATLEGLRPNTKLFPYFDSISIDDEVKPADIITVSLAPGQDFMDFNPTNLQENVLRDAPGRSDENGINQEAYEVGDVIRNEAHTAVDITGIAVPTAGDTDFTVDITDATGIDVNHHVVLYALAGHNEYRVCGQTIPSSSVSGDPDENAAELQLKPFRVINVAGTTLTVENLDQSEFDDVSTYVSGGELIRIQARAVVAYDGAVSAYTVEDEIETQDLHLVNVCGGFAVGDTLTGQVLNSKLNYNTVVVDAINENAMGSEVITDADGSAVFTHFQNDGIPTGEINYLVLDRDISERDECGCIANSVFDAKGFTANKVKSIVSSRQSENITLRRVMSQDFVVKAEGGMMATSVDLYFATVPTSPVEITIRSTEVDDPAQKAVPGTTKLIRPRGIVASDDASIATNIKFDYPVYLREDEVYSMSVRTADPDAKIWVAEGGQKDIRTNNTIVNNYSLAHFHTEQNVYTVSKTIDRALAMSLNQAVFTESRATIPLRNETPEAFVSDGAFFETTNGSTIIKINMKSHGFRGGDEVVISDLAEGIYADLGDDNSGIPHYLINGPHTVLATDLEIDSFTIDLGTLPLSWDENDIVTGLFGSAGAVITRQLYADNIFLNSNSVMFAGTSVNYEFDMIDSEDVRSGFRSLGTRENRALNFLGSIRQRANEVGDSSVIVNANLTSSNKYLSPVVDMTKFALYATADRVSDADDLAVYVSKPLAVDIASDNLKVIYDANVEIDSSIEVYYRSTYGDQELNEVDWELLAVDNELYTTEDTFATREFTGEGLTKSFDQVQVKIVFKSTAPSVKAPKVRNLRVIAYV